jgi:hypothetical protein
MNVRQHLPNTMLGQLFDVKCLRLTLENDPRWGNIDIQVAQPPASEGLNAVFQLLSEAGEIIRHLFIPFHVDVEDFAYALGIDAAFK